MEEEMEEENDDARVPSMWVVDLLGRLSVMDKYLVEFDTDLRGEIKGQHALRRTPTTPVAQVDRADPDDPSPPRHDDPYVMFRDAAARKEGVDAATTSDLQPSQPPGSPHYHL
ncbi:hypothetical protein Tco_0100078 [Tanacetum coccineum]